MAAHYYIIPKIPGFGLKQSRNSGLEKTADCNTNLQLYLCTDTSTRLTECILTIYNR